MIDRSQLPLPDSEEFQRLSAALHEATAANAREFHLRFTEPARSMLRLISGHPSNGAYFLPPAGRPFEYVDWRTNVKLEEGSNREVCNTTFKLERTRIETEPARLQIVNLRYWRWKTQDPNSYLYAVINWEECTIDPNTLEQHVDIPSSGSNLHDYPVIDPNAPGYKRFAFHFEEEKYKGPGLYLYDITPLDREDMKYTARKFADVFARQS